MYRLISSRPKDLEKKLNKAADEGYRVVSQSESAWVIKKCFGLSSTVDSIINVIMYRGESSPNDETIPDKQGSSDPSEVEEQEEFEQLEAPKTPIKEIIGVVLASIFSLFSLFAIVEFIAGYRIPRFINIFEAIGFVVSLIMLIKAFTSEKQTKLKKAIKVLTIITLALMIIGAIVIATFGFYPKH